jgi:hypothetical protein
VALSGTGEGEVIAYSSSRSFAAAKGDVEKRAWRHETGNADMARVRARDVTLSRRRIDDLYVCSCNEGEWEGERKLWP